MIVDGNDYKFSSNIDEAIRSVYVFFEIRFHKHKKA